MRPGRGRGKKDHPPLPLFPLHPSKNRKDKSCSHPPLPFRSKVINQSHKEKGNRTESPAGSGAEADENMTRIQVDCFEEGSQSTDSSFWVQVFLYFSLKFQSFYACMKQNASRVNFPTENDASCVSVQV